MILRSALTRIAITISLTLTVASCGGGGENEAGSLTAFNIVPTSITLTGPDVNTCGAGYGGRVYVYGGAGPYRIDNSGGGSAVDPPIVTISKTQVNRAGDFFDVTLNGGCMTNIAIVVVDQLGRQSTLSVNSAKGK
jgi:hypothetical protein